MKAPKIDRCIRSLRGGGITMDAATLKEIDKLFDTLSALAPCGDDDRKELWLSAERGTIEDYGNFEELLDWGEVGSRGEFEAGWRSEYPDEESWYHLTTVEHNGFRAVYLGRELIWESEIHTIGHVSWYEADFTELFRWITEAVKERIQMLKNGSYNKFVENHLPPKHRTGIIARKDYWSVFPEYKADYFSDLPDKEVQYFLSHAGRQKSDNPVGSLLSEMTAGLFFKCCSLGYKANGYERIKGIADPKDQYKRMADGRDDGLLELDENDPEAFEEWLFYRKRRGGHPWEVCAGGNSTHIDLYASKNDDGYYVILRGTSYGRSVETIKFYNALLKENVPVYLMDADLLIGRVTAFDMIGIVPDGIPPFYCGHWFPEKNIADFINLPYDAGDAKKMLPHVKWFPEKEQFLK